MEKENANNHNKHASGEYMVFANESHWKPWILGETKAPPKVNMRVLLLCKAHVWEGGMYWCKDWRTAFKSWFFPALLVLKIKLGLSGYLSHWAISLVQHIYWRFPTEEILLSWAGDLLKNADYEHTWDSSTIGNTRGQTVFWQNTQYFTDPGKYIQQNQRIKQKKINKFKSIFPGIRNIIRYSMGI